MRLAMLSGGVGGARLARGLAAITDVDLTVIVNVGDDERIYGLLVSPDIDTVVYTMAGREGPHGWGLRDDPFTVMAAMDALPHRHQLSDRRPRYRHQPVSDRSTRGGLVAHLGDHRSRLGVRCSRDGVARD